MGIILGVVIVLLLLSLYANYNLIKKVEKYELEASNSYSDVQRLWTFVVFMRRSFKETLVKIRTADQRGMFESDDYVGVVFKRIVKQLEELEEFINSKNVD